MHVELEPEEIEALIEGLDYLKTKIAYVKGPTYAEKTERLQKVEAIEQKLRGGESAAPR
jgi:hypothetical protein